ncbi:MAG: hypothetical protein GF418_11875 [Chitinivibrionales bacterium]|nr:hypothetical protein [Chitinivibrionales bacterium]MBD3396315.1 hypothetical protein [Chitinivibrionales bacterium]
MLKPGTADQGMMRLQKPVPQIQRDRPGRRQALHLHMPRRRIITASIAAAAILAVMLGIFAFRRAGPWLVVTDPLPASLDIILTLGGEKERYDYAKVLARRYPDAFWIISVGWFPAFDTITLGHIVRRSVVYDGFDTARVLVDDTCTSTGAEIKLLRALLEYRKSAGSAQEPAGGARHADGDTHGAVDSAGNAVHAAVPREERMRRWLAGHAGDTSIDVGITTSHYHTRRVKLIAQTAIQDPRIRFHMLPVPYTDDTHRYFREKRWWRHETDASFVVSELVKMLYYGTLRRWSPANP